MKLKLIVILLFLLPFLAYSQCPEPIAVNLSSNITSAFSQSAATIGPLTSATTCCPNVSVAGERCIRFSITLNPNAGGIRFEMSPSVTGGVYRIGCSTTATPVGSSVCLQGAGPHMLTFCSPTAITSLFKITSLQKPSAGPDISVSQGCSRVINAVGFDSTSVTWTSLTNNPVHNSYLSCTTCLKPTVNGGTSPPAFVDYKICGNTFCGQFCDTVRVNFAPALAVTVNPQNPAICNNQSPNSTSITASGSGGTAPYSYLWNNINASPSITVPSGFYTVVMTDNTGCSVSKIVEVKKFTVPVSVNAGLDKIVCKQNPVTSLNGSVLGAYGGTWTGGNGTFSPNNNSLTGTYTPTSTEIAAGFVNLTLTSTGTGTCAPTSDIVHITYSDFIGNVSVTPTPISCNGGNNGSATVTVAGGSAPYTYSWATVPTQTAATATGLSLSTYSVTITDAIGCKFIGNTTLTQPPPIGIASQITNITCPGGNNGAVSISASGGTPPYTYTWLPGNQTTSVINGVQAGTYTVTVKDSKNCTAQGTYTIAAPIPLSSSFTTIPVSCFNGNDGKATAIASGGTAPYTYNWTSGATAPDASGLSAGTYTLNVTDIKGCTSSNTVNVSQPASFTVTTIVTPESCHNSSNGTASATAIGGSPNYTFLWQPGGFTNSNIANLQNGTYTVTATDTKGCTATGFAIINEPLELTINFISKKDVSCFSGNNGFVTANPLGGTLPYTYSWSPSGATTAGINNLQAGTYSVTVTDNNGCFANNNVTITEPSALLTVGSATITDVSCNGGNNGAITINPAGGTTPYSFLWQPGNGSNNTISNINAGTYNATITDFNGCQITSVHTVNQPSPINLSFNNTPVSCYNGSDGTLTVSASGGNLPYTYTWMPGNLTTETIQNLPVGTYSATVTDSKGCSNSTPVNVIQPPAINLNPTITNVVCSGGSTGSIVLNPTGGKTPFSYSWTPGGETSSSIQNLAVGNYSVTVTDGNSCSTSANYTITQQPLSITLTPTPVSCYGGNDGSIASLPSGGTPNYSYSWTPGGATTNAITNLTSGSYTLSITDSKGCNAQESVTVSQPDTITTSVTVSNKTCSNINNGTATANALGGTPGYTYLWQPGLQTTQTINNLGIGTYTVTISDTKNCSKTATGIIGQPLPLSISFTNKVDVSTCFGASNGSVTATVAGGTPNYSYLWLPGNLTTQTISNLAAGTYSLTVTDNSGCTITSSVTITQPNPVSLTVTSTNESCNHLNNGTAIANAYGGTPTFTYVWQPGNITSNSISNLSAGGYTVIATDSKGCNTTKNITITEPPTLTLNFSSKTNVSCFGGSNGIALSSVSGGNPNYSYSWAPGGATTANRNNLSAGTFTLSIVDAKGCTVSNTVTITQPNAISATSSVVNETCSYSNNGSAAVTPSGGTPGYTYAWQPGLKTTASTTGLKAGTYTVTVKDSKGCSTNINVVVTEPPVLDVVFGSQVNVSCFGGNNGSVTASASGGTAGYTYLWTPGGATTASRTNLTAATYSVTVTDSKGCVVTKSVKITQPAALFASISRTNETCNYLNNGTLTANPTGGTTPYTYLWQPGSLTSKTISNLSSGTYSVTITDAKGCVVSKTGTIEEPLPLTIAFNNVSNVSCNGGSDGVAQASISGGTLNYSYSWAPGGGINNSKSNLAAGTYTLTVTDFYGCTTTNSVTITQPAPLSASASHTNVTCSNGNNGTASATPLGGASPYTYKWIPGNYTNQNQTGLGDGTYSLVVTDANGCKANANVTITEPDTVKISGITTRSGCNIATGTASLATFGGTAPYSHTWAPYGGPGPNATNLASGTYTITIADANNCLSNHQVNISDDSVPGLIITSSDVLCYGDSTGFASVDTIGNYGPVTYLWSPSGDTLPLANNLSKGFYSVRVRTLNGCKAYSSVFIDQPDSLSLSLSKKDITCYAGNDGTAEVAAFGGVINYSYLWTNNGSTSATLNNLTAGQYVVTITDGNGCQKSDSLLLIQPANPISVTTSSTPASCFGGNTGTISTTNATGGNGAPYTYSWQSGTLNGQNIIRLTAGTYTLSASDSKGCIGIDSAIITQPTLLTTSFINQINVTCNGENNGSVSVQALGGTPGYNYLWIPESKTTASINNLYAGKDSIIVSDANGCVAYNSVIITEPSALAISVSKTNETCDYLNNGTGNVITTGATPPYTYQWMPGNYSTASVTGLAEANYTLTVTDSLGCKEIDDKIEITQPDILGITFTQITQVSCFGGNDASITTSISGGTPSYTYLWSSNSITTNTITNLTVGTYTLNITDANNCIAQDSHIITEPTPAVSVILSSLPASCFGKADGTASASASGGTPPYNYNWMPGNLNGDSLKNIVAGTYTVTVTDLNGCTLTDSITVLEPTQVTITHTIKNANCGIDNGQASVAVSGGFAPYNYLWIPNGVVDSSAINLAVDSYTVYVTDNNACNSNLTIAIGADGGPTGTVNVINNVSCSGFSDGNIAVSTTGIAPPFSYVWYPAGGTNDTASNLASNTYTVIVTDSNGCASAPIISPEVTQPDPIYVKINMNSVSCFGGNDGSASATITGGTPGYNYLWLPSNHTGTSLTNLVAGPYSLQITDANNCQQTVAFTITQPDSALSVNLSMKAVNCFAGADGEIYANAVGGTAPYNYYWNPGNINGQNIYNLTTGNYTVSIVDAKGCAHSDSIVVTQPTVLSLVKTIVNSNCSLANGQASVTLSGGTTPYNYSWFPNNETTNAISNVFAGTYIVTVTDSNSCKMQETLIINDNPSPTLSLNSVSNVSCYGGNDGIAIVNTVGNAPPYTYLWLPSGGTNSTADSLTVGTYTVIATDTNMCQSAPLANIIITEPQPIITTVTKNTINCFGDSNVNATASVSGGTPGYSYLWLPSNTTGSSINNLSAGNYSIQITDINNCIQIDSFNVIQPVPLVAVIDSISHVSCFGGNNGTARVNVNGGTPLYNYNWQPFGGSDATGYGLSSGNYTVTVTDLNGCTYSNNVTINEPSQALSATAVTNTISCFGLTDGTSTIIASGGTPGFSYTWSPSVSSSNSATNLIPGNYTIQVSDTNGCEAFVAITVTEPSQLSGALISLNPSCSQTNGSITAQISGGTAPYTYLWSNGGTNYSISGLWIGEYSVQITDANGCSISLIDTLTIAPDPYADITAVDSTSCFGGNDGSATVSLSYGTPPFSIIWYPSGGNSLIATNLTAGTYTVVVTDFFGCIASDTAEVFEPTAVNVSVVNTNDALCNGTKTGSASVLASGGTGSYSYTWLPYGSNMPLADSLGADTYSITVMDQYSCNSSISLIIDEPTPLTSTIDSIVHPLCYNGYGSATASASGGTLPYNYLWQPILDTNNLANNIQAGTYTVAVTDANGCVSSSLATVNQPTQVTTLTSANDTICVGQSGQLSATATGGAGNYYYAWQPSGAINIGSITINPTSNITYTVVAFDALGCSGTADTVSAIVYTFNDTSINAFATSPVCPGQASVVYVESYGNTGNLTYQWSGGLGNQSGVYTVNPVTPSQYIVTVNNACASFSDTVDILINPPPIVNFVSDTNALCVPGVIQFTDSSITGNSNDPITSWMWNFGDGSGSSQQDPSHTYTSASVFAVSLTVTTSGGCTNNNSTSPLTINGHPYPTAAFSLNATELNLPYDIMHCNNQSQGANNYIWNFGDGVSSTQDSPNYLYSSIGVFNVELIATTIEGCADTAYAEVTTTADVVFPSAFTPNLDASSGGEYDINSLNNDVFFPYTAGVIEYNLQVYNRWGEIIFESDDIKKGWDGYYKGKLCQQDVYIWKAFLKLNNGKEYEKNGSLTLLY